MKERDRNRVDQITWGGGVCGPDHLGGGVCGPDHLGGGVCREEAGSQLLSDSNQVSPFFWTSAFYLCSNMEVKKVSTVIDANMLTHTREQKQLMFPNVVMSAAGLAAPLFLFAVLAGMYRQTSLDSFNMKENINT